MTPTPAGDSLFGGPLSTLPTLIVAQIVTTAYRIAGIITQSGRGPGPSRQQEGFAVLNSMLDAFLIERLLTWAVTEHYVNIIPGKGTYTIGTTGAPDIVAPRPIRIDQAGFVFTTNEPFTEVPLEVLTYQQWQAVSPKTLTSTIPSKLYYQADVPNGTIYLWAIPTEANQFTLYLWQALSQFTSLTQSLQLPPAYQRMLEYNLAREVALRFPRDAKISPQALEIAATSKRMIKAINNLPLLMRVEEAANGFNGSRGMWNIFSNTWSGDGSQS